MKPVLSFHTETFTASPLGPAASVPDLLPRAGSGSRTLFFLDEDDEIYEGYGKLATSYPYRQYTCYGRTLKKMEMDTAVLENDFLKAVFLPGLGGRLWSLTDKNTGKNLLYTNDVIRPSNLAVRNAWASGGAEWNIGLTGHSPFTMDQLFTARLADEKGLPILRMYEYERIRKVTFQMDFWLEEHSAFLHCRMRIFNQTAQVVPMYWWSNIAAPEYEGGRVIAPAGWVYTNPGDGVRRLPLPFIDGVDISYYQDIPKQADYFFNIPKDAPKYIANLGKDGYGLVHMSTSRLKSRKLFSWGNNEGSDNWQDFLTKDAGRYVEIQAGLGKTQYGCIPMAPHTAWEWLELYGPIQASPESACAPYLEAERNIRSIVQHLLNELKPERTLAATKALAKTSGELLFCGSGYAAFEDVIRKFSGEAPLSGHLDFSGQPKHPVKPGFLKLSDSAGLSKEHERLAGFLKTGIFPEYPVTDAPYDFLADDTLFMRLAETIGTVNKKNWYAHYQLGLCYFIKEDFPRAKTHLLASSSIKENPWALHALAVLECLHGSKRKAVSSIISGYAYRKEDLSYLKETWRILLLCHAYDEIVTLYDALPGQFQNESRIRFGYMQALSHTGQQKDVLDYLDHTDFVLDDLREGEDALGDLWRLAYKSVHGRDGILPQKYNFDSLQD